MSSELRRQLRVALGPKITGLQRAVALEIADDARYDDNWRYDPDKGRRSKVRLAELVEWTGAKDINVVRNAIKRLSAAGWEFRVPIGQDKHGKPMYAVPGKAMTFRVPDFEGVATATPMSEGGAGATPRESQGSPYGEQGLPLGGAGATPPSLSSLGSPKESPSSSPAPSPSAGAGAHGGGGGVSFDQDQGRDATPATTAEQQQAEVFVDALDYRGLRLEDGDRGRLLTRVAAAFTAGWTDLDLKTYLDLGTDRIKSAPRLYLYRLDPVRLPDPHTYRQAQQRPLEGTDANVAGWMALAGQPHRPFDGGGWDRITQTARNGDQPAGSENIPWCGDPDCDPVTRTHEERDWQGLPSLRHCAKCHPAMQL